MLLEKFFRSSNRRACCLYVDIVYMRSGATKAQNDPSRPSSFLHAFSSVFAEASWSVARFGETQLSSMYTNSLCFFIPNVLTLQSTKPASQYQDTSIPQINSSCRLNSISSYKSLACGVTSLQSPLLQLSVPFPFLSSQLQCHYNAWDFC